jgi:hypothetical protein
MPDENELIENVGVQLWSYVTRGVMEKKADLGIDSDVFRVGRTMYRDGVKAYVTNHPKGQLGEVDSETRDCMLNVGKKSAQYAIDSGSVQVRADHFYKAAREQEAEQQAKARQGGGIGGVCG